MGLNFDGKILATSGKDRMIKLWDLNSNKLIDTLKGHRDTVNCLKFARNNNTFLSGSSDRTLKVWDAGERAYIDSYFGHKNAILSLDSIGSEDFVSSGFDR